MKLAVFLATLCLIGVNADQSFPSNTDLKCDYTLPAITQAWTKMTDPCIKAIQCLIDNEFTNVWNYLALANYYLQDSINRPGFANQYILDAYDARHTAIRLIDYLTMRGKNIQGQLIKLPTNHVPAQTSWSSLIDANQYVLQFEAVTTDLYHTTIASCEKQDFDDYHVVNWLSRKFLGEQYDDMKEVADQISSLMKMKQDHQRLGEYLYDIELYYNLPDRSEDDY